MARDNEDKTYTSTEVGTLIESFRHEIGIIGEKVTSLCDDIPVIKERLTHVEFDIRLIKDVIRIQIPDHEKRISILESKVE